MANVIQWYCYLSGGFELWPTVSYKLNYVGWNHNVNNSTLEQSSAQQKYQSSSANEVVLWMFMCVLTYETHAWWEKNVKSLIHICMYLSGVFTVEIHIVKMEERTFKHLGRQCAQAFCCCFVCNAWGLNLDFNYDRHTLCHWAAPQAPPRHFNH